VDGSAVYGRLWNPTVARFESALARLEHTEAAVAFSSGMAAATAAIIAMTRESGRGHIVAVRPLYGGTDHLLASGMLGTEVTFCAAEEVAAALRPDTALVMLETPANPTLDLVDIRAVAEAAGDVPVLVDNTFATPVLQNPADLGAAMVLHSATKYLGGHGDVIAGVIACDQERTAALRRVRAITGALLHPLGAYLLHRGLATLPIRVRAQQENARRVAAWLSTHPAVSRVYYPGTAGDARGLLHRQMRGPGAMLSIELHGGLEQARSLTSSVRLFTHAVSLGGVDSLIQHPASLTHRPVAAEARPAAGLVRLSLGLEDPEDLMADLDQALGARRPEAAHAGAAHP
ncbi:aminotransferase class I/II-fold pyridoxal phosphate-dependent enzyme, partial [Spirillospora sp. NPDC049652]